MTAIHELQAGLTRFFALRQMGDDEQFKQRLRRLQDWQDKRLRLTHAQLLNDPKLGPGMNFLLDEIYAGEDLLPIAREIDKAVQHPALRLLPDAVLRTSVSALEAAILTQELDEALAIQMGSRLDAPFSVSDYACAFRDSCLPADRARQLKLIGEVGHLIDRYIRSRLLQRGFRLVRRPVRAGGFSNLYDFLERGFTAMDKVNRVGEAMASMVEAEKDVMNRLFSRHPDPFGGVIE